MMLQVGLTYKFCPTAGSAQLWQHHGFCPGCALRGRDLQQKQRGTNSSGTSYWSAHHSTPLTTYLGFPDFNVPTECSTIPKALRGQQMSADPHENSYFVSLPVGCCFWGTMINMYLHTPLIEPIFILSAKYWAYQNKRVGKHCRINGSTQPFLIIHCIKLLWEKPYKDALLWVYSQRS